MIEELAACQLIKHFPDPSDRQYLSTAYRLCPMLDYINLILRVGSIDLIKSISSEEDAPLRDFE